MKKYLVALLLGTMALATSAQETAATASSAPTPTSPPAAPAALPEGVVTEQNPLKQDFLAKAKSRALFRPSPNMPEIVNEDLIRGYIDPEKVPAFKKSTFIGYLPKLKVLPCAQGCEGPDYDRAVKDFLKGYRGEGSLFKERGEMVVQVRWFNVRSFMMRQLPYEADRFGVQFMLEGKVVSLGKSSGAGKSTKARELAEELGGRLALELAFTLGMGTKPSFIQPGFRPREGLAGGVHALNSGLNSLMSVDDVHPRIEPATAEHANLLPAIDGILPNEIDPITEMRFLNLMFVF